MAVVVKFHGQASPSFVAWQQRLLAKPPHDPQLVYLLRDEMIRWFQQFNGMPPGTVHTNDPNPRHVAKFSADTWVHFQIKKTIYGQIRTVIVIGLSDSPP